MSRRTALDGPHFGASSPKRDWNPVEHDMLQTIDIEKLLAVERATVEPNPGGQR